MQFFFYSLYLSPFLKKLPPELLTSFGLKKTRTMALSTEAYWGHSIYEYIFSISGKICVISISEKIYF